MDSSIAFGWGCWSAVKQPEKMSLLFALLCPKHMESSCVVWGIAFPWSSWGPQGQASWLCEECRPRHLNHELAHSAICQKSPCLPVAEHVPYPRGARRDASRASGPNTNPACPGTADSCLSWKPRALHQLALEKPSANPTPRTYTSFIHWFLDGHIHPTTRAHLFCARCCACCWANMAEGAPIFLESWARERERETVDRWTNRQECWVVPSCTKGPLKWVDREGLFEAVAINVS